MEKRKFLLVFFSAVLLIILTIFVLFTTFQLYKEIPYGMSRNYTKILVHGSPRPISNEEYINLQNKIKEIIKDKKITLVVDNYRYIGLKVYDSENKFGFSYLYDINLSNDYTLKEDECPVAVKKDSYIHKNLIYNDNKFSYGNDTYIIKDVYDSSSLLYDNSKEIIVPYFYLSKNMAKNDDYYIDTNDIKIVNQIYVLIKEIYDCSIEYNAGNDSFSIVKILSIMTNNVLYLAAFLGILFTYFNYYLYYSFSISEDIKNINILMLFGANKTKIFINFSKKIALKVFIGSILGIMFYIILFGQSKLKLPLTFVPILIIIGVCMNYLCFTIAFINQKMFKYHKEKSR